MVIGNDGRRPGLGGRSGAAEECLGGGQVPPFTKQYVDHLAVLIDGAVEVPLDGAMEEEDLVDVPAAAKPTTMPAGCGRELWTEVWVQVSAVRAETSRHQHHAHQGGR